MRLLVYGGNEHNIRCEIGGWDLADKGPLYDTYGIPKGGWTVGFGILNNQGFLFLKTKQTAGARTYPFTILFDPGEEIWHKFGWNAAHLAFSITYEDNKYQTELVNNPESFGVEKLEAMTKSLRSYEIPPKNSPISELIAGTVFETEPLAVNPLQLENSPPALEEIVSQIEALPFFLRTGNGWLFGGSSENAAGLGIKLVFDTNLQTVDAGRIKRVSQKGAETLESLKTEGIETQSKLAIYSMTPAWRWKETFNASPSEVLTRLGYLAELENRSGISDDELLLLDKKTDRLFAEDERRIIHRLACRANGDLTPFRTDFLLEGFTSGEFSAEQLPKDHFHQKTYINWLVKNKKFPSESEFAVRLQPFGYFEVCQQIIANETNLQLIPGLFQQSIIELSKNGAYDFIGELAETVEKKTSVKLSEVWFEHREADFFKDFLAPRFEKTAREATKNKHPDWTNIYLRFANDRGGHWLLKNTSVQQAKAFTEQLIWALTNPPGSREATAWLEALTISPLRSELSTDDKITISRLNNKLADSWRNFTSLMDLLEGKTPSVKKLDSPEEAAFLHRELAEFFEKNPGLGLSKIRIPLKTFFGEDPVEFVAESNRRGEKVKSEKDKQAEKNTVQKKENQPKTPAAKNEIIPFDEAKIGKLKPFVDEMCQSMQGALSEEATREKFINNFQFDKNSPVYSAFPYLPLKTRANILRLLYEYRAAEFKTETQKLFKEDEFNPFAIALWECLLHSEIGRQIKADLKKRIGEGVDLDAKLAEIIEKSVENEKWGFNRRQPEDKREDAAYISEPGKSFWRQYFGWVIFWKK
jgi:hypothetical protein